MKIMSFFFFLAKLNLTLGENFHVTASPPCHMTSLPQRKCASERRRLKTLHFRVWLFFGWRRTEAGGWRLEVDLPPG